MSNLGDVLRKLVYSNVSQTGSGGGAPSRQWLWGSGGKATSRWVIFVKFGKKCLFWKKIVLENEKIVLESF